jgi:3-(3-hydroxy-phenyl)propionate hydroxylase
MRNYLRSISAGETMTSAFKPYPFEAVRHSAALPRLDAGVEPRRHPVVVVGGGPVGLTAAIGLANQGVPVVVLEADDSVCFGSRAICISRRSLEIAARHGAVDGFLKIGLPWTGGRSFYQGTEVLHFLMPQDDNQKLPPMVNLAQYHIEQILLDRAEQMPDLIDIRWQAKLTHIDVQDKGATLSVSTPAGDYTMHTDWVVAADGGRSFIRESLGLQLQGTSYEGRYAIVDILMDSPRPTERLAYFDPTCNPGSTVLVHKQPDNVWRIDYQIEDGQDPDEAIRPENVMPRVQSLLDMMGETAPWSPIWTTVYKANALTLEHYRHGRVLFAGDAAHLVPIFGVRGANSGIDDADNLAWKLAYVVTGKAQESLLNTYSAERVAATHENLSYGTKSTEFMAPPSFAFELMRRAVLSLAVQHPGVRSLINPRQTSAIAYTGSSINVPDADTWLGGPPPGTVLPECPITRMHNGQVKQAHITDLIGQGFSILHVDAQGTGSQALQDCAQRLQARGTPTQCITLTREPAPAQAADSAWDHTGRLLPMYGAEQGAVYLVRPDGHVLARWKNASPAAIESAIGHALQSPHALQA